MNLRDEIDGIVREVSIEAKRRSPSGTPPEPYIDAILAAVREALTSEDTVREVSEVHEAIAPHPLMRDVLVRGILNTATYAAGITQERPAGNE